MIIPLTILAMQVAAPDVELRTASVEWARCAERAAVFTARTAETAETANELALDLCPTEAIAVSHALQRAYSNPVVRAEEEDFYRRVAGARSLIRILFERTCPSTEIECAAFFKDSVGMERP